MNRDAVRNVFKHSFWAKPGYHSDLVPKLILPQKNDHGSNYFKTSRDVENNELSRCALSAKPTFDLMVVYSALLRNI